MCGAEALSMTGFAAYTTLLPQLQREWGLSNSEAGAISGFLFAGYMVSVPVLTSLTDRMDSRRIYFAACLIGSLGAAFFALFGQGFWTAAFAQFLIGAALGGYKPVAEIMLMNFISAGLPSPIMNGGMSCTTLDMPPIIA